MTQIVAYIIDFTLIVIAATIIITAFKRGFLRSIVLLVGYVLAVILSIKFSGVAAEYIYDTFIYEHVVRTVDQAVATALANMNIEEITSLSVGALPALVSGLIAANFGGITGITTSLEGVKEAIEQNAGTAIVDTVVTNTLVPFMEAILCVILFIIMTSIVGMIAGLFKNFYAIPILGPINTLLGGVIGVVQAGIVLFLLVFVSMLVVKLTDNNLEYFNQSILNNTFLFKWFMKR